jgi:hypothetical protein
MDDLIVVILTLLVAGAGAIGQLKKKKEVPVAPGVQKTPEDIWDLFKQETFAPELKTEPEYFNIDSEESGPSANEQGYNFEAEKEGGTLITNQLNIQPAVNETTTKKKEKFPLRKAVIYSEILNRKYC